MPTDYRNFRELDAIRTHVRARAQAHGGVFRREYLPGWGVEPGVLQTMVRRRWWVRLHHGVYTDASVVQDQQGDPVRRHLLDCAAGICALRRPTHAFASTAAALHGLPIQRDLLAEVQLVRDLGTDGRALQRRITSPSALPGISVRTHDLSKDTLVTVAGVASVSRELAAVSAAAMSTEEWAIATLDAAAWQRPDARSLLHLIAQDWPHLRGIGIVRSVLPQVRHGAQTPLESLSRYRLIACGLPEPQLQVPLYDDHGLIGYVDMAWLEMGVIGEADGLLKYQSRDDLIREKSREDRLRALGYIVVRWTWDEIIRDAPGVAARIRAASQLAARRAHRRAS